MTVLELALTLELDMEKYYKEQADVNKGNSLETVFSMLAKDEQHHAEILKGQIEHLNFELNDNRTLLETKKIFENMDDFSSEIKDLPSQLDTYRMALEKEEQSVEAYQKLLSDTSEERFQKIYQHLIRQEKEHYEIIELLIELLTKPEEWVESAEFGVRKEY